MQKARFFKYEQKFAVKRKIKYKSTTNINLKVLHFACKKDKGNIIKLKNYSIYKYRVFRLIRYLTYYSFYYKAIPPN